MESEVHTVKCHSDDKGRQTVSAIEQELQELRKAGDVPQSYTLRDVLTDLQELGHLLHEDGFDTPEHFAQTRAYVRQTLRERNK